MVPNMLIGGFISRVFGSTCCLVIAIAGLFGESVIAQSNENARIAENQEAISSTEWLTGNQRRTQLRRTIRTSWSDITLSEVINQIATSQKINVFLDRRVDKNREIRIPSFNGSVFEALHQVLAQSDLHGVWVDDVFYIGSLELVARLVVTRERVARELRERPEPVRRKWLDRKQFDWARLTRPDDMIKREFPELDAVTLPHDLWPAWSGPEMTRIDLLLVIANGFDLQPALDSSADDPVTLIPMEPWPLDRPFENSISLPNDKGINQREILTTIKSQFPDADFRITERAWIVTSTVEQSVLIQEAIDQLFYSAGDGGNAVAGSQKVISLRTQASIGGILATVAKNLKVELQFDPTIRPILEKRIDIDVEQVSYEVLIETALADTGLTFELTATTLVIGSE